MPSKLKVLILGANGFIGSHLVDSIARQGHIVRAFDRYGSSEPMFEERDNIEVFTGDYLNKSDLSDALFGIDYVFHFISTTTPATAENDPTIDIDTNIRTSVELFDLCVKANVKRVIFASTGGAIYGAKNDQEPHEETDLALPVSPYAIGKLTIEHYLRYFRVKHNLDSIVLRISNPYGERQPFNRKQGVIPIFLENCYRGIPLKILGDGSMVRDYIYVKDVAQTIAEIFDKDHEHSVYNLGSGSGNTINELVDVIKSVVDKPVSTDSSEVPSTFLYKVVLNTNRINEEFDLRAGTKLEDGIAATYEYIKSEFEKSSHEKVD